MEISLKQGGCRAGSSWGRRRRSARLTSSVTPTSGNPVRERARAAFFSTWETLHLVLDFRDCPGKISVTVR